MRRVALGGAGSDCCQAACRDFAKLGSKSKDPFEGLSPGEINERARSWGLEPASS